MQINPCIFPRACYNIITVKVNKGTHKMIFAAFILSTLVGAVAGIKISRWIKSLPVVEIEQEYEPSLTRQMYERHLGIR